MKKILCVLCLMFAVFGVSVSASVEQGQVVDYTIQINGEVQELKNPVVSLNDRTYLPLREMAELLNLYVVWDGENQMIKISDIGITAEVAPSTISFAQTQVTAHPVNFQIKLDGYIKELENPIYTICDWTYLPVRELSELLGAKVDWVAESKTVAIEKVSEPEVEKEYPTRLMIEKDGLYGFMDAEGNIIVEPQYSAALIFTEGLAAVADENGRLGYIDVDGNLVIPHRYSGAYEFGEGLAMVMQEKSILDFDGTLTGLYTCIDREGNIVIDKKFFEARGFMDGLAAVCLSTDDGQRAGYTYIDKTGEPQTDKSFNPMDMGDFRNGYAQNGKTIMDKNFETVFDGSEYDSIAFTDGVVCARKDRKYGIVDFENNVIIDFKYDYLTLPNEGLIVFKTDEGYYGYMDLNETIIIPPVYVHARGFYDGLADVVPMDDEESRIFINKKGEQISKKMKNIGPVSWFDDVAMVFIGNGKKQYYTTAGELIEPKYE